MCSTDLFLGLLALIFPPLPVWVKCGICSSDSIINILLCMLGYLPGLIHSWYIIAKFPEPDYDYRAVPYDSESGRIYIYVNEGNSRPPQGHNAMSYGTTAAAPAAAPAQAASQPAAAPAANRNGGEGSSSNPNVPPPSYAQVIAGDNKIQSQD